jgi:hypothetical protein
LLLARITVQLICRGATLNGVDRDGNALVCDRLIADGLFLDEGFTAAGAVRLPDANIAGQLNCRRAKLTGAGA